MTNNLKKLWEPSEAFKSNTVIVRYMKWLEANKNLKFDDYESLRQWSVEHIEDFYESVWQFYEIQSSTPYQQVLDSHKMPGAKWFYGATLNYAEHVFRSRSGNNPAIIAESETRPLTEISWSVLEKQVAKMAAYLRSIGLKPGDRVVAYMPNIPETAVAFLAACSMGAVWSAASPDFGTDSVIDRFQQISPKVLFCVDGYSYDGKKFSRVAEVAKVKAEIKSLETVIMLDYMGFMEDAPVEQMVTWEQALDNSATQIKFEQLPFDHPLWVVYSSGTTGIPKAITHSHGGVLIENYKYVGLLGNLQEGDRYFWYSTTGWVMWNMIFGVMLCKATAIIYDGNPAFGGIGKLWSIAEQAKATVFGGGAAYFIGCMKAGFEPAKEYNLEHLQAIGSTGSPLPIEAFEWIYDRVKSDVWLYSASGGTDIISAFVGSCPLLPVYAGEIQCRELGVDVHAFDDNGNPVIGEVGEMVITKPMPSMPIYFWNDEGDKRYIESYFEMFPGYWRHGDWMSISERGSVEIVGRSDSTLNRGGIRIGTSEVYRGVDQVEEVLDSLIVSLELGNGSYFMPLFVQLREGLTLNDDIVQKIKTSLMENFTRRHVPDEVFQVDEIPYTMTGKKLETPVKKILLGFDLKKSVNPDAMKNPDTIDYFIEFSKKTIAMCQ